MIELDSRTPIGVDGWCERRSISAQARTTIPAKDRSIFDWTLMTLLLLALLSIYLVYFLFWLSVCLVFDLISKKMSDLYVVGFVDDQFIKLQYVLL